MNSLITFIIGFGLGLLVATIFWFLVLNLGKLFKDDDENIRLT